MKNACQTAHSWHEMPSITEETMSYLKMGSVWVSVLNPITL